MCFLICFLKSCPATCPPANPVFSNMQHRPAAFQILTKRSSGDLNYSWRGGGLATRSSRTLGGVHAEILSFPQGDVAMPTVKSKKKKAKKEVMETEEQGEGERAPPATAPPATAPPARLLCCCFTLCFVLQWGRRWRWRTGVTPTAETI